MSVFYDLMNSAVRGTIYGACLAINGYGLFLFFRFIFRKCRQLIAFLKRSLTARAKQ
ncbi:hypothetical protein ACTQ1O_00210 [Bilifractor sp. LCP21S3_A7]|jgi:hypothetical protein|uniref:hypothetical protein n=1 Tax=Bilifractor sp. LCP21S3_A7 TaxID=3438738 RepID=UPI002A796C0F|nr:hypothetical protein [Lachnospiraceae bacterium]